MTLSSYAARAYLSYLLQLHPDWSHAEFAAALGYSKAWVKKWRTRLRKERAAGVPLEQVLQGHSRARKHPPVKVHPLVARQVLAVRDQPLEGLRRVPGQETIRYSLLRDPALQFFHLPIPSCRTIYRILKTHQRIPERGKVVHQPLERPAPMSAWQIDCKDVSSVPADPDGKRQHVVETQSADRYGTFRAAGCACALRFHGRDRTGSPD